MSDYCGLVQRQDTPVDVHDLVAMSAGFRGAPEATGRWAEGPAAFSHAMRFTTPESLHERLPWRDSVSGLVITADARIDNRAELGDGLGLPADELRALSDSELLLRGYLQWGETLLERLLGDYTFAIWDARQRTLFCARDHFGVRPFYHTLLGDEFVFATDLKALFAHPRVSKQLNLDHWLAVVTYVDPAPAETFYAGIHRLPPGSWLRFDEHGLVERRYWSPDPTAELPPGTNEEYAEEFRRLFAAAVACRLRSAFPVGTHLSGGVDSSAITCVAREALRSDRSLGPLPLRTFSAVLPTVKTCDESEYISAVLAGGDLAPTFARPDDAGILFAIDDFLEDEPDFILRANGYLLEHLGASMRGADVRVCLDGFDGDTTVSHGSERLTDLVRRGDWATFCQEVRLYASLIPGVSSGVMFHDYALPELERLGKSRQWKSYLTGWRALHRHYDRTVRRTLAKHLVKTFAPSPVRSLRQHWRKLVARERGAPPNAFPFFTGSVAARLRAYADTHAKAPVSGICSVRATQCQSLSSGMFSNALEMMARLYGRYGIDGRHPFLDKRLVEFCVALPADQKLRAGQGRFVMREGLRGILPDAVRLRFAKTDYTPAHVAGVVRYDAQRLTELICGLPGHFDAFIDRNALLGYLENLLRAQQTREQEFLDFCHTLMSMAWLQKAGLNLPG